MGDRKRRPGLLLGLALGAALALGLVWQVGKRLLDVDQYRGVVAAELERWTGLPVTIGRLDLALRPIPALAAYDVSIGRDALRAVAARIHVLPELGALWDRRIEISRVALGDLELTLPADPARLGDHWNELVRQIEVASQPAPTATTSAWGSWLDGFALHRVVADDVRLRLGPGGDPWLRGDVALNGLADADVDVELDARVPAFGTRITGRLDIRGESGSGSALEGDFQLRTEWPDDASAVPAALRSGLAATARLRGDPQRELTVVVDGTIEPRAERALSGSVSGELRLADAALRADFAADGPELALRGSARSGGDGDDELRIDSLDVSHAGVAALIEWLGPDFVELSASETAALGLRGLALRFDPNGGPPRIVSGSLSARGFGAGLAGRPLAREIVLEAEAAEVGVAIRTLRGGPFDLAGELLPEPDWSRFEIALYGDVALTPELFESAGLTSPENVSGRVRLEALRQTFPAGAERDALPRLRARIDDAGLRIVGDGWVDELSGIDLRVATEGAQLRVEGRARSRALGNLNASASWRAGTREAQGRLGIDPADAEGLGPPALWEALAPLLRAWEGSGVTLAASWPEELGAEASLRLEHAASPTLKGQLALRPEHGDGVLGDLHATVELPAELFEDLLPAGVDTDGSASLEIGLDADAATFSLDADLGGLTLRSGQFVEKRAGDVLRLTAAGDTAAQGLRVTRLAVASAKASLPLAWQDGRLLAPDLDVDLAAWSFLLGDGASASGRLRGRVATNPLDVRLELSDVGLRLSPDLGLDTAEGTIALGESGWSVETLRMRGAGSDLRVDASLEGEQIRGRVAGASLDVDLVQALAAEVRALLPERDGDAQPLRGTLDVKLDRVRAGRSEARGLATEIRFAGDEIHVPAFELETYEGRIAGALDVLSEAEGTRRLDLKLDIANVTGRFLDDLLFEQAPRDVRGVFSGTLAFSAPLAGDPKAMLAAGDGRLSWSARNGSFGKLGFATRLTTVLRATQALRLRLPPLRDEGLVFDTVKADFQMEEGLLRIEAFELDTTSYAISAGGSLDFARDRSDVPIEVNATKGLTGLLGKLPLAGDALQIVNVRLRATGSPYDLTVRMASFKDQIVRASAAGPKSVVKRVRDAVALTKRANGTAAGPGLDTTPETPASGPGDGDAPEAAATEPGDGDAPHAAPSGAGSDGESTQGNTTDVPAQGEPSS